MTTRATHRWYGVAAVALIAAGAGVAASRPALLLAGVVGVAYAAYARSGAAPAVDLEIERELSTDEPDPGGTVVVTLRARNAGPFLPDLRLVDGVPGALSVTGGSPRFGTALRSGKVVAFDYELGAERGRHDFDPVTVVARDASGATEREMEIDVPTSLTCVPRLVESSMRVPLRAQTAQYTGPVATDTGGSGVEFFATREYRPGDAMTRIDWNRLARTGQLSTVEYREERMATVVLAVDARAPSYEGADDHALERSVDAAGRIAASLLDAGHLVGIGALGTEPCFLAPGTGEEHRTRIERTLAMHPALAPTPPTRTVIVAQRVRELRRRLPANAQVVLLTPLLDDYAVALVGRLQASGHATTVVSPDVTAEDTPGRRLAHLERRLRVNRLRGSHVPVIDWEPDERLERAMAVARVRR